MRGGVGGFRVAVRRRAPCAGPGLEELALRHPHVRLGNEILLERGLDALEGRRIGLITNPSGVTSDLVQTVDALCGRPGIQLGALFAPEHGIRGEGEAGASVAHGVDRKSGARVFSLYGDTRTPTPEMLGHVDVLVFDIQDVGVRLYTYVSTLAYAMRAAARHGLPLVVLDRPNPIGGLLEGNLSEEAYVSFVGAFPMLLRHGMTVGELAQLFNARHGVGAQLTVIPMTGWKRRMFFDETGLAWVPPSPNMPTLDTALAYPGTCLLEGTNLSVGRGTTKPFEQFGAPFVEEERLADALNARELPGVRFRPVCFVPGFGELAGQRCEGVGLHITDRRRFRAVVAGLEAIVCMRALYPHEFGWRPAGGGRACAFDLLMGTDRVRKAIDAGAGAADLLEAWREDQKAFEGMRAPFLLYE